MFDLIKEMDLDQKTAICIGAGMRQMAAADNEIHPKEIAMIDEFLSDCGGETGEESDVDLSLLNSSELQDAFVKCLALVALSDGKIRDEEVALLDSYVEALGYTRSAKDVFEDVGKSLLAQFRGVTAFRAQAEEFGRSLGLSDAAISDALDS